MSRPPKAITRVSIGARKSAWRTTMLRLTASRSVGVAAQPRSMGVSSVATSPSTRPPARANVSPYMRQLTAVAPITAALTSTPPYVSCGPR